MIGVVAWLGIVGLLIRTTLHVDPATPTASFKMPAATPLVRQPVQPPGADGSTTNRPAAESDRADTRSSNEAAPARKTGTNTVPVPLNRKVSPPQSEEKPTPTDRQRFAPVMQPPPPSLTRNVQPAAGPMPPKPPSSETDGATRSNSPVKRPETPKKFKNDPRIDLQALVWAADVNDRFVVINNRLIKEGGSVDDIVVVKINPDDVLLAEGSERWHEKFKIQ
ncbi:MAG: general secretion pathway protein GspB [Desulfosarcina sp.]